MQSPTPYASVLDAEVVLEPKVLIACDGYAYRGVAKASCSPACHVPNEVFQVEAVPRTLAGKKMELPVKKLLMGTKAEQVCKLDAVANAGCVAWSSAFAERRADNARVLTGCLPPPAPSNT